MRPIACRTAEKVSVMGSCYLDELCCHVDLAHLPASIGGDRAGELHDLQGEPFAFDTARGGALWLPDNHLDNIL